MQVNDLTDVNEIDRNRSIVIYGSGITGKICLDILEEHGYSVKYFIDDDICKIGKCIYGKQVISLDDFESKYEKKASTLIIGSIYINAILSKLDKRVFYKCEDCKILDMKDIYNQRKRINVSRFITVHDKEYVKDNFDQLYEICPDFESRKIIDVMKKVYFEHYTGFDIYNDICSDEPQYFTKQVVSILKNRNNSILDGGAYHGEILSDLIRFGIPVKKLTLFEVEQKNYNKMLNNIESSILGGKCVAVNQGLWDKSGEIYIEGEGDTCRISNRVTDKKMQVISIDEFYKNNSVDFMKMDIEGAERQALKGGIGTIKRDRPVLAICIYHSPEDFVGIPIYLNDVLEEYSYNILHHTNEYVESILYAIPDELLYK